MENENQLKIQINETLDSFQQMVDKCVEKMKKDVNDGNLHNISYSLRLMAAHLNSLQAMADQASLNSIIQLKNPLQDFNPFA